MPQTWPRPLLGGLLVLLITGLGASALDWQPWAGRGQPLAGPPVQSRPSLMVVPFEDLSDRPTDYFAEGVAQEVLSGRPGRGDRPPARLWEGAQE